MGKTSRIDWEGIAARAFKQREAEHQAWLESESVRVRLLDGFTAVGVDTGHVPGSNTTQPATVMLYECDRCAALVRPVAEAQVRHKLNGCS